MLRRATTIARTTSSPANKPSNSDNRGGTRLRAGNVERLRQDSVRQCAVGIRRRDERQYRHQKKKTDAFKAGRKNRERRRPESAQACKGREIMEAIPCRTKPDIGEPESVTLGLCIGRSLLYRAGGC
jgi:hypothetical protein